MPRQKTINIFNKNHITITKTINCQESKYEVSDKFISSVVNAKLNIYSYNRPRTVRKKSSLGFYYECTIKSRNNNSSYYDNCKKSYELTINLGDTKYTLLYYTKYGDLSIHYDTRPWDLHPEDKDFSDHYIISLQKEVEKIFRLIEENRNKIQFKTTKNISDLKASIFTDLFGHKKGYMKQTNEEKILSHGFDLKTSFRKM